MSGSGSGSARLPATSGWSPSASLAALRERAALLRSTREFFAQRDVLEVETPALSRGVVVETHLDPMVVVDESRGDGRDYAFLQTSPEACMKRLVASGSGPVYQLCRVFRAGESGRFHNPEFTMLEWYRPGFDLEQLMDEVGDLLATLLPDLAPTSRRRTTSYRQLFVEHAGLDPFACGVEECIDRCAELGIEPPAGLDRDEVDAYLDLILSLHLQAGLGADGPLFLIDFPPDQAALAQVREDAAGTPVAARFEVFLRGVELANGYLELLDADEQRQRFAAANERRVADGRMRLPPDEYLLAALGAGLPSCAGVAVGFDRIALLRRGADHLDELMAFPWNRM